MKKKSAGIIIMKIIIIKTNHKYELTENNNIFKTIIQRSIVRMYWVAFLCKSWV